MSALGLNEMAPTGSPCGCTERRTFATNYWAARPFGGRSRSERGGLPHMSWRTAVIRRSGARTGCTRLISAPPDLLLVRSRRGWRLTARLRSNAGSRSAWNGNFSAGSVLRTRPCGARTWTSHRSFANRTPISGSSDWTWVASHHALLWAAIRQIRAASSKQ